MKGCSHSVPVSTEGGELQWSCSGPCHSTTSSASWLSIEILIKSGPTEFLQLKFQGDILWHNIKHRFHLSFINNQPYSQISINMNCIIKSTTISNEFPYEQNISNAQCFALFFHQTQFSSSLGLWNLHNAFYLLKWNISLRLSYHPYYFTSVPSQFPFWISSFLSYLFCHLANNILSLDLLRVFTHKKRTLFLPKSAESEQRQPSSSWAGMCNKWKLRDRNASNKQN